MANIIRSIPESQEEQKNKIYFGLFVRSFKTEQDGFVIAVQVVEAASQYLFQLGYIVVKPDTNLVLELGNLLLTEPCIKQATKSNPFVLVVPKDLSNCIPIWDEMFSEIHGKAMYNPSLYGKITTSAIRAFDAYFK